ncbi:MAG: cytochrome b [Rhizobiales bacterium]|nr:cytochrome b [Hyphomicrobiales bacterium]
MTKTMTRYSKTAIYFHWLTALLLIPMLFLGEELMEAEGGSTFLPSIHVSAGVTILALAVMRLLWRLANPPPPLPATMKPWERTASHVLHGLFYLVMIGVPLSGWLSMPEFLADEPAMSAISLYGALPLPAAPNLGAAKEIHEIGGKIGIALLALHVLAALKHQFFDRDNILARMWPR